jgi:multisubunit Na+/H+ antiporter MnhG subunit
VEYIDHFRDWASQFPRWQVILCVVGAIILFLSIAGTILKWSLRIILLLALIVLISGVVYWWQGRH